MLHMQFRLALASPVAMHAICLFACRSALYMVVASALNAAHVQFTLPPFPADVCPAYARAQTALECQPELAAGMGLPPAH